MTKAYYGTHLMLPKECISGIPALKRTLEFPYQQTTVTAWTETRSHLVVPREFLDINDYKNLPFPVENRNPTTYPTVHVNLTYELRDHIQEEACESLLSGNGLLVLSCGKGKTVISLHAWARYQVPAVIVVPTLDLAHQWKSRILEHTSIMEEEIGWIQGHPKNWTWHNKPISIAILKTVALYPDGFTLQFKEHYGVAIYDEVHRLGAPFFNSAAGICCGRRWGLSATPFRKDGLDEIYRYHLGKTLYENTTQENVPNVYFLQSKQKLAPSDEKKLSVRGDLNFGRLVTWLSENEYRNKVLIESIKEAIKNGRNILVLSDRVEHLKFLNSCFPKSGLLHGSVKGEERERVLQDHDLVFASTKIAKEGLDKKALNTVFITTPLSDEGMFTQIIGRAQRGQEPMIVVVEDQVGMCKSMCNTLRGILNRLKYKHYKLEVQIDE